MEAASVEEIVAGNLVIRPDRFLAHVDGQPVALTMRELSLLVALARRPGRVVSREELYAVVWQQPYRRCERSVDVYVGKLRQKLEDVAPDWRYIHTHCGFATGSTPSRSDSGSQPFHIGRGACHRLSPCEVSLLVIADTAPALPARGRSAR
jgi:hypothetical protein